MLPTGVHPTEKAFTQQVIGLARLRGWLVFHDNATNAARRCPKCGQAINTPRNTPGFPDLVLVRDRVLFRELKVKRGKLSPEQMEWRDGINVAVEGDYSVWTPDDWDRIEEELR
jgi:hypothetical protein